MLFNNKNKVFRPLCIFLLVCFIFTFTFKPKKTDAFALSILGVSGATVAIGAIILLGLGFSATNEAQQKYEARQLMEKYGKDIELEFKPLIGESTWMDYPTAVNSAIWEQFTGRFRLKEGAHDDFSEHMKTVPIQGVKTDYVLIGKKSPAYSEMAIMSKTGGEIDVSLRFYYNGMTGYDRFAFSHYNMTAGKYYKVKNTSNYGGTTFSYELINGGYSDYTLSGNYSSLEVFGGDIDFYKQENITYTPTNTEGVSKDLIAERLPVSDTVDLSKTTDIPLSLEKDKAITDIPGLTVEKAPSAEIPITGWGWLDNILGKILGGILGIPISVLAGLRVLWGDITSPLNAILELIKSIPIDIANAIADVFVPTLSISDSIDKLKAKVGLPSLTFPSFDSKEPLRLKASINGDIIKYDLDVTLDQPWFPIARGVILGFEMLCILAFAYIKISNLHGGGGD